MASIPPQQGQARRPSDAQMNANPPALQPQQPSGASTGFLPQTTIPPLLTQINPTVGGGGSAPQQQPQSRVPIQTAVPPAATMPQPTQQQPQHPAGPNPNPTPTPTTLPNLSPEQIWQLLDFHQRYAELPPRYNALVGQLQRAQQELQTQQRNYAHLMTSWNEYKDANEAYKAEHEREAQRIKDLEDTIVVKTKLSEQGWGAMTTWKDTAQKEARKVEEMKARMDRLAEQLNQTHLEGMQWKACALSWNDPKGDFQQALVKAISDRLGEQYATRDRAHLERIRELEHQVAFYRRQFPDVQVPPLPPLPPQPPKASQPHPQQARSQPPPQPQPQSAPPSSTPSVSSLPIVQTPYIATRTPNPQHHQPTDRRASSSSSSSTFVASPANMQTRVQGLSITTQPVPAAHQVQMPVVNARPPQQQQPSSSSSQQQQQQLKTPTSAPLPSAPLFETMRNVPNQNPNGFGTGPARRASLPVQGVQHAGRQPHPVDSLQHHPSGSHQANALQQQAGLIQAQRTASGSFAPPNGSSASTSTSGGQSQQNPTPAPNVIWLKNGRPAGFVAQRTAGTSISQSLPQKRSASSDRGLALPRPPQPSPQQPTQQEAVKGWDLDDVMQIPADDVLDLNSEQERERERVKKKARVERSESPDVPLALSRTGAGAGDSGQTSTTSTDRPAPQLAAYNPHPYLPINPPPLVEAHPHLAPPPIFPHSRPPAAAAIVSRNQRTDSVASVATIFSPQVDRSASPPPMSDASSVRASSPEIGRLVPVRLDRVVGEEKMEEEEGGMEVDDHEPDSESVEAMLVVRSGSAAGESLVDSGTVRGEMPCAPEANDTRPQSPLQTPSVVESGSSAPPRPPPIAVLPPPRSPSSAESGEATTPAVKPEVADSPEEGEIVGRTPTPAGVVRKDVEMEEGESEDVKPRIGVDGGVVVDAGEESKNAGKEVVNTEKQVLNAGEVVMKTEDVVKQTVVNGNGKAGSQEEPFVVEEQTQDSVVLDFLTIVYRGLDDDASKVGCLLCERRGVPVTLDQHDLAGLLQHCEQQHSRPWKVRVLDVLAGLGIEYVPPVVST